MSEVFVDQFIASHKRRPKKLIVDFDTTDDRVHGQQEGRFFHGYHDHYCFLPLYVFCGDRLLTAYLRPAPHRRRQAQPGDSQADHNQASPSMAEREDRLSR